MTRFRALLLAVALGGALAGPRAASADRPGDAAARLAPPLRALLARFIRLEPQHPAPQPALDDEFDAEAIDRVRASRRAERDRTVAGPSDGAAAGARRASGPSSP